jgi:hypothetical protein
MFSCATQHNRRRPGSSPNQVVADAADAPVLWIYSAVTDR